MKYCNENNKIEKNPRSSAATLTGKIAFTNTVVISIAQAREAKISQLAREQVLQKARKLDW